MAKKKQLKFNINNATKGKTYDLKNVSDIYITYDSNLEDCLDMSVSGSTLTMKVSGNVVVYKFTNISDSMPIKVYHSNGTEKFNGTLQEFYSTYDFTPVDYSYTTKKNVITGTALSDDIDVHDKTYNGKGYTINAGAGDDTIRGTLKADTITGGAGNNVINYTKGDGNDVINLTKNETLTINMSNAEDVYTIDDLKFAYANKNKDLRIYTDKNSTAEFITIKNFASKDVNGNGDVFLTIGKKTYNLETSQNVTNPINPVDVALYKTTLTGKGSNFTGTWLNDEIDASAVEGRTQKVKKQVIDASTNKGLTLNGGNGNDTITGSKYSDTINGGNGNDIIYASNGNDGITGGKGTNTLIYSTTDFGKDTITLTKGETLNITGLVYKEGKTLATSCSKSGNNLLIDTEHGQVVLKNFYTKNTGATVNVDGMNLSEVNLLAEVNAANYFEIPGKKLNAKYTGTALADIVNASGLSKQTAKGGVGVTINTGLGADEVTGSNFKDTINTGDGNDTINGSLGADKLTGGTGENEIIYTTLAQLDGDTINLTKNEKLDICVNVAGATATYKVSGKNLVVTVNDGNQTKSFTIANFGSKDVTTANGAVNLILNGADPVDLRAVTLTELNVTKNYTGTWHADNINASAATKGVTLNGGAGNDIIVGSALKDTIKGGAGDDTITGGLGNDNLYGEGGKNTFIFNKGDKNDTLYSGKGTDTLKFTDASDLTFTKSGKTDLIVKYNYNDEGTAQDSITIKNYFDKKGKNVVSSVKYVEMLGKTYDIETLRTYADENEGKLPVVVNEDYNHPEDNADKVIIADNTTQETKTITTGDGDNVIYASENTATNIVTGNGNNEIHGGNGGTITTGTGNDVINSGNSTQINAGAGENEIHLEQNSNTVVVNTTDQDNPTHNTIIFDDKQENGNTIVFADKTLDEIQDENTGVTFVKDGSDLVIVQDENNTTTLSDYLNQDNENISETTIKGSGDTTATLTDIINNKGVEVTADIEGGVTEGTGYNDNITGSANNDVIYTNSQNAVGGTGSNVVNAGAGDDEIHLQEAHNEIHIGAANGNDTIIFEENQTNGNTIVFDDKTLEQVEAGTTFTKEGNDLVIHKDENNTVTLQDYLNEENENVNENIVIKGSDGATQSTTLDDLLSEATITITGSENIEGTKYSDNITGSNTGDLIDAGAGADSITGGAGNDIIIGGLGNDTLTGGTGNNIFIFNENDGKDTITDATSSDTIKLDYTPEQEPTYSVADGKLTIKIDENNQITTDFDYSNSENNIDTVLVKNEAGGYTEISIKEDIVFDKTISVNDTDYEKTTPYSENITIAEGVTGVSVSGLNENDSIQVAVDDEQQPTYSRTDNGGLVISGTNDNAVTVTDFFTNGEDITVNGNTTEDITVNVTLTNALEGTYESTDYNEVISGTGTVSGLTSDDKVEVEGAVSYSRTNNGALVIEGATSGAITVSDFNFNNPQTINVNDGTTENMTVNVTLTEDYNYTATACKEVISGQGSVSGATSNTIIYMGDDCEDAATCVGNDITFTNNDDNVAITIKGFFNDNGDIVFAGNCCVDGTAIEDKYESVALNDIDLTVSGRTNFSNVIEYQGEEHTIFHSVNITGTDNADTFIGGEGSDTISGGAGNDTITGGQGNDTLTGGTGSNTFIFNENDGADHITDAKAGDIIQINTTATPVITKITEDAVDKLQIAYDGGTIVTNYDFAATTNVDDLKFKKADGSYQTISISDNISLELTGTAGVDNLAPDAGKENYNYIIEGKGSADTLKGGTKNNTFIFSLGDGNDTILHSGGTDTLVFAEGATIITAKDGNDLKITYSGVVDETPVSNTITVTNYYTTQNHSVKYFKVGDTTYSFANYYCLSRGDDAIENISVTAGSPVLITLTNPFGGENYKYTFSTDSTTAKTFSVQYLDNGRFAIVGNNINVVASSDQADDIILYGDYNNVETGDLDDIVRVGGAFDMGDFVGANHNTINTGSGNDHVQFAGLNNNINTGEGTDSVLAVNASDTNTITNAEFNRVQGQNEPYTSVDGALTTFNQFGIGDCRVLSMIESLAQKNAMFGNTNAVTITDNGNDSYTVTFNKYNHAGKVNSTTVTKTEIEAFDGVYGDVDVVLTDIALNKLLKLNGDSTYARERSYAETATYNVIADYFTGSTDMAVAQSVNDNYQTRVPAFWALYQAGTVKNINVGFVMQNDIPDLGLITGHSYSIKNLDVENGVITLVNPWNNQDVVNLDLDTFYNLDANVYIYGYKYNNETYNINNLWAYNDASANPNEHSNASAGNDLIVGGEVADNINALAGDDKIIANEGNDTLTGGEGADKFIFQTGDGKDIITDASSADKIVFAGSNLNIGSLSFARGEGDSTSLFITYGNDPCVDRIEIQNYFELVNEEYVKRDGTVTQFGFTSSVYQDPTSYYTLEWKKSPTGEYKMYNVISGNDSANTLVGIAQLPNYIEGKGAADTLTGSAQNDIIIGGKGNDTINAGLGTNFIKYSVGDGDDIINAGGGTDTLVFEAGTTVTATYGSTSTNKNDLILTYSGTVDETPVSNTITLKNYKTTAHSVQNIKVGNETSDIADLISIGTTEYYTRDMGIWPILQRGVYGTDSAETLAGTPTGYYATGYVNGESYYTYGGNDNIVLRRTSDNGRLLDNVATFKVGDGNDTVKNSEWVKDGAALYSEEQAIYQEKVYTYSHGSDVSDTHGSTGLNFKGVHLNAITAEKDGDDIVITYATANTTDTVRIKNGYYSTNVDGITAYDIDSSVYQVTQPMYYADVLPNSEEWESHRQTQQTTDYGYGYGVNADGSLINGTKWYESTTLRDLVHDKNIVNGEDATLNGWIWSDSISASDDKGHTINGYGGSDTLTGGALADTIYGGEGHDIINGSDGNDVIYGFRVEDPEEHVSSYISDNDTINGGAGNDTIYGGYGYDTINGGTGEDEIHGSVYYSTIHGDADNDNIEGVGELYGDGGNDTITGKGKLYGGAGDDTITLQANQYGPYIEDAEGNEVYAYADGGDGNDTINLSLNYATRNAVVLGGAGDDEIGSTRYYDEELGRWVFPSYTRDVNIDAGSGNDHIVIRSEQRTQNVTIQGGAGDDTIEYQYSFRADSIGTGIDNTDVSIIKDSSGNDTLALIGTNNMSYHGNGATPVAFFDMTIDNNGNITSLGEDNSLYVATTFAGSTNSHNLRAYGDKTKSLKLESVLSQNGNILSSSIENIYIRGEWMSDECGYYKLDVENLAKAYANYLKTTTYRSLQAALTNGTAQIKEDLAQIAIGSWTHTMYRPVLESDDQAVYGDGTDKVLDADYGYAIGSDANETINGTTIEGVNGYYDGGAGNDTINAGEGDDVLIGGVGNDTLSGGDGADKFYFSVGDGNDVITDAASVDTIVFVGVTDFSDITLTQKEDNKTSLFINYGDTDTIEIQNYFVQTQHPEYKAPGDPGYNPEYHSLIPQYIYTKAEGAISKIGFVPSVLNDNQILNTSDETYNFAYTEPDYYTDPTAIVYNYDTPQKIYSEKTGDAGNNNLVGDNNKLNVIKGLAGNDTITGGNQADVIYGGTGNDTINAGAGQNFIHYALGDGNDTIVSGGGEDTLVFAEGTDVVAAYSGNDLVLTYSGNGQSNTITLTNYKTTEHSVKNVKVGNNIQAVGDLIVITQTDFYNYTGDPNYNTRSVWGTNNAEILMATNTGNNPSISESYHGYGGDDRFVLRKNYTVPSGPTVDIESALYFKPGDGNDTVIGANRIKEGAAEYSEEQAKYQAVVNDSFYQHVKLNFVDVDINDITAEIEDNDIILHYTANDSVRIVGGYYSTEIYSIDSYFLDHTKDNIRSSIYSGDITNEQTWESTRTEKKLVDYGNGNEYLLGERQTKKLSDLIEGQVIDNSQENEAKNTIGWIWNDTITASNHGDTIKAYGGDDVVNGGNGADSIYGGAGDDTLNGGNGNDRLYGEAGNDTIHGGEGNDYINPGDGNDVVYGDAGDDTLIGSHTRYLENNDLDDKREYFDSTSYAVEYPSTVYGGAGSDTIYGYGTIYADDVNIAQNGTVTDIQAGAGNDYVYGAGTIYTGYGNDTVDYLGGYYTTEPYTVHNGFVDTGAGNDTINLNINSTSFYGATVNAGTGDDYITGRAYNYYGYQENNIVNLDAGAGNDHVVLSFANSVEVDGGAGNDLIEITPFVTQTMESDSAHVIIRDSGGNDDTLLLHEGLGVSHYSYTQTSSTHYAAPLVYFDMTINTSTGAITSTGNDIYISASKNENGDSDDFSYETFGDTTKAAKLENALVAGKEIENIYIENKEDKIYSVGLNRKHGYSKLNIENLKTAYANYLKTNGYSSVAQALSQGGNAAKEALARICLRDDVWEYSLYRPTYTDDEGQVHSIFATDEDGVYGNATDQTLNSHYGVYSAYNEDYHSEFIVGGAGNEKIYSSSGGDDLIYSGAGNDFIYAGRGNDEIHAGTGNNTIALYNDYRLGSGWGGNTNMSDTLTDGNDTVYTDGGGVDTLDFGQSIAVKFAKSNNDLKVYYNFDDEGVGKSFVTVKDFYNGNALNGDCSVKKIKLLGQDVANLTLDYISSHEYITDMNYAHEAKRTVFFGTDGADDVDITNDNNFIYGGSGDDNIKVLDYATGTNYLDGGAGDDIYDIDTMSAKTVIYDSGNDGTVEIDTTKANLKVFYDMQVTVSDGVVTACEYNSLRLYTEAGGIENGVSIMANPNLAGATDGSPAQTITAINANNNYSLTDIDVLAAATSAWIATNKADGVYSTADMVSAGGDDANAILAIASNSDTYWHN